MTTTTPMYRKPIILSIAIISLFIATKNVSASESTQLYVTIPAGTQRLIMSSTTAQVINTAISAQATTSKGVAIKFSAGTGNDENNWPACSTHNLDDYTAPPNVGAYTYFNGSVPITNAFTPSNGANYIFFWAIPGGGCDYAQAIGYIVFTYAGGGSTSPSPDYEADLSTRVISIYPEDDQLVEATSTNFELWSLININIDDYVEDNDWYVRFRYIRQEDLQLAVANTDLLYTNVDVPITQWPNFDIVSATTSIERVGTYLYTVQIRTPSVINNILGWFNLNNLYDPGLVAEKSGTFIVVEPTQLDSYIESMASTTDNLILTPGTFDDVAENCNPISGFSFTGCISGLLIPNQAQMSTAVDVAKTQILNKAPVGYVSRVVSIVSSSATTSLPDLDYTPGSGPLEGQEFHFEPNALLASADTIIRTDLVSDQNEPKNLWDIFMPIWNILIYAGVLLMIVSDVTGIYNKTQKKHP